LDGIVGLYFRMKNSHLYPRHLQPRIMEELTDSPVVLIHGPRQCGKTTLARQVGDMEGFTYLSFDDEVQRAAAQADPVGYVADLPERVILLPPVLCCMTAMPSCLSGTSCTPFPYPTSGRSWKCEV
jgi:hypothetical protein